MNPVLAKAMLLAKQALRQRQPGAATQIIKAALAAGGMPPTAAKAADALELHVIDYQVSLENHLSPTPTPLGEFDSVVSPQPEQRGAEGLGGGFDQHAFACAAGKRVYKLFVPDFAKPRGLIVMLHGCTQGPDDFAAGTDMNAVANTHGLLVAYPAQPKSANASTCWNWFKTTDQSRDAGEPAIIAGLTLELMQRYALSRENVFIAGLSAGGAMAVILAATYPEIYSAVGIHSGLPYRAANDLVSALSAMKGLATRVRIPAHVPLPSPAAGMARVRTIVIHGSADHTVHPANAEQIVAAASRYSFGKPVAVERRGTEGGRSYRCITLRDPNGPVYLESWLIEGAGHAWSGGKPAGSYTDQKGPDASKEMLRFVMAGSGT